MGYFFQILLQKKLQLLVGIEQLEGEGIFVFGHADNFLAVGRHHGDRVVHQGQAEWLLGSSMPLVSSLLGSRMESIK